VSPGSRPQPETSRSGRARRARLPPSPRYYAGRLWLTGALALDAARSAFEDAYALDPYGAVARDLLWLVVRLYEDGQPIGEAREG